MTICFENKIFRIQLRVHVYCMSFSLSYLNLFVIAIRVEGRFRETWVLYLLICSLLCPSLSAILLLRT